MSELTEKDKQAIDAAEETTISRYCDLSRASIKKDWQLEPEELAKLEFNGNGYLACGIQSSKIVEHITRPEEEWTVEVVPHIGVEVDPDVWRVYQGNDGEWIVDAD